MERRLRPHPTAVAQRDREAPHLAPFATGIQAAEMTPIHLRLFAGRRGPAPAVFARPDEGRSMERPGAVKVSEEGKGAGLVIG